MGEHLTRLAEEAASEVIDAALTVHKILGPGLLESVYEASLEHELQLRDRHVARQVAVPVVYKDMPLSAGLRLDLLVSELVVVEVKAVGELAPIHHAQLLSYLRLTGLEIGLLLNFNSVWMRDGMKRVINRARPRTGETLESADTRPPILRLFDPSS